MTVVGENIRKIRENSKMTIKELSAKSGVGRSTISEIETGTAKNPKSETLTKIAKALSISLNDLTEMECGYEYENVLSDVEEAFKLIFEQTTLLLDGKPLCAEAKFQLMNSIKLGIDFAKCIQKNNEVN